MQVYVCECMHVYVYVCMCVREKRRKWLHVEGREGCKRGAEGVRAGREGREWKKGRKEGGRSSLTAAWA